MKSLRLALTLLIVGSGFAASTTPSRAADCTNAAQALAQVQKALATDTQSDDRAALLCIAQALAALDAKVTALANTSKDVPFVLPFAPTEKAK